MMLLPGPPRTKGRRFDLRLPEALRVKLAAEARRLEITDSELVRRAVERELRRLGRERGRSQC